MLRLFTITNAILAAVVAELMVLGITAFIANDPAMFWQYAARYSARVSFLIIAGLLLYTTIHGLFSICNDENKRKVLIGVIYFFCTNHIIHLIFLVVNQTLRNKVLVKPRNAPGMIVYCIVFLLPLLLNRGLLRRAKQTMLLVSLMLISAVFIEFYINRLLGFQLPPDPSARWVYLLFATVLLLLVLTNLYRHIKDSVTLRLTQRSIDRVF